MLHWIADYWPNLVLGLVALYVIMGIVTTIILSQTPYQDNPLWAKFLLWPLYWWWGL